MLSKHNLFSFFKIVEYHLKGKHLRKMSYNSLVAAVIVLLKKQRCNGGVKIQEVLKNEILRQNLFK